jgi:hypothetical protein
MHIRNIMKNLPLCESQFIIITPASFPIINILDNAIYFAQLLSVGPFCCGKRDHFMKSLSLLALALIAIPNASYAQQSGYVGMHHLKTKPAPTPVAPPVEEKAEPEDEVPALPVYKAMLPKDALVKQEDLEKWDHMSDAALAHSDLEIHTLVHLIESDRGAIPPQGLFLAAKSLADRGMMEQASVYYFVGQLRLSFDMERWPAIHNKDDVKRRAEESKKSPDQAAPNLESSPRIDNPHQGIKNLGDQIGAPIISWVLKDPDRMDKMIRQVKQWDVSSPYAYLPDYELTDAIPFEKWDKLLVKTREMYFSQLTEWSKMMAKVRR